MSASPDEARAVPTATACASKGSSPAALTRQSGASREHDRIDHWVQAQQGGGPLNPAWVEWLTGWPIGHTASEPLGTAKFRSWLQSQHLILRVVSGWISGDDS